MSSLPLVYRRSGPLWAHPAAYGRAAVLRQRARSATGGGAGAAADGASSAAAPTGQPSVPVGLSLAAALLGVATVSLGAAAVEAATAGECPPYHTQRQRFDESRFAGRFSRMLLACDPRLLLYSEAEVRCAKAMLDDYHNPSATAAAVEGGDRALWEARRLVDSALHPDTGAWLPRPFRMSGYVPYNGPVCVAMVASQSTAPLLFWSWVNQSQNALVNYYNRNASSSMTNETLAKSYSVAVGSALVVAFGLATAIQRRFEPARARQLLRWVAFPSAVVASSLNCFIVRSPEIDTGIPLTDENGQDVLPGTKSQVAARRGVYLTTASRAILQAPVFFLPPLMVSLGPVRAFIARRPALAVPVSTYMILVCFGLGLPATVAIFPQIADIPATEVEAPFRHLMNAGTDRPHEVFYYNKGL